MKTTLVIDDGLMARLREEAVRQRRTMSELVEAALRRMLEEPPPVMDIEPFPEWDGGGAMVDLADRDALYQAMEGR
jgi:hypothetical protein